MSATEVVTAAELARLPLFEGLPEAELEPLAGASRRRFLRDGETLVEIGQPISEVHWVEQGHIALRIRQEHRWVLVSTLKAGDLLGWSALRDDAVSLSTSRAIGPAVLVSMPAEGLLALLAGGSSHSQVLLRRLFGIATQHLDESRSQLLQLGREGVISAG